MESYNHLVLVFCAVMYRIYDVFVFVGGCVSCGLVFFYFWGFFDFFCVFFVGFYYRFLIFVSFSEKSSGFLTVFCVVVDGCIFYFFYYNFF